MSDLSFTKMQGLGNDFIVVEGPIEFDHGEVSRLCDRRFGIGADGILAVTRGDHISMDYWNADGSAAEMCGNGLRCVARYVFDRGWSSSAEFRVFTPIGDRGVEVLDDEVEVELGPVDLTGATTIGGVEHHLVDVGNPHAVRFVDDPGGVDVEVAGRGLQEWFPGGINVEFAAPEDGLVRMRVWERGVGETLACGTGMAAVVAATRERLGGSGPMLVASPGGRAVVDIRDGVAWLRGPAEYSFSGSVSGR